MHYHYFTLEQREALSQQIADMTPDGGMRAAAFERLRSPDYGLCEVCRTDIPFIRLLRDPFSRTCGRCVA